MIHTVSIAEMKISNNKSDEIVTHALGSCIGLVLYDPKNFVGGLIHFMLPVSNRERIDNPLMYADTGIPIFLNKYQEMGGNFRNTVVKAAGGALINDAKQYFNIGKKNIIAMRKVLWNYNLVIDKEDLGGDYYRTIRLILQNGKLLCKNHTIGEWEI